MIHISNNRELSSKMPPGFDLSTYNDEVKNQFELHTNELRRITYFNSSFQTDHSSDNNSNQNTLYGYNFCRSNSMNSLSNHLLENHFSDSIYSPDNIVSALKQYNNEINNGNINNNDQVMKIFNEIIKSGNEIEDSDKKDGINHTLLMEIANDDNVVTELLDMYSSLTNFDFSLENQKDLPQPLIIMIVVVIQVISVLYKYGDVETQNTFSDEMTLSFNSLLSDLSLFVPTSEGLKAIIKAVLGIIILIAQKSEYGRNCLVCFGVQSTITRSITNVMSMISTQIQNNYNIFVDLNNMSDIDIEILHMICLGLKEIFAYTEKFNDCNFNEILDIFIDLVRLGIENGDNEEGIKRAQFFLTNCFENGERSIPFIIKEAAFDCLTSITNHKPSNSVILCEKGLHLTLLNILKMSLDFFFNNVLGISDLSQCDLSKMSPSMISGALSMAGSNWGSFVSSLLKLIVNTASSQPKASSALIENGLIQMLMSLIQIKNCFCSNCTNCYSCENLKLENKNCQSFMSDTFWILSNMLPIVPEILVPLIPSSFIQFALSQATDAPVGIKREISFFLATCILHFTYNRVGEIFSMNDGNESIFFELMDEMISSGRNDIAIRCIDSMINLILLFSSEDSNSLENNRIDNILYAIDEIGFIKDLEELIDDSDYSLANRATSLYNKILRLSSKNNC